MEYAIVPIDESHVAGFHAALDAVAREKKYLAFLEAPPVEEIRKFILGQIEGRNPAFVALVKGEVAGWCDVTRRPRESRRHCGLLGMALLPAYRGGGIGRALMQAAIACAWEREFTRIELDVREDNVRAIALYKRLGFEVEGVKRNSLRVDGEYYDALLMSLLKEGARRSS